MQSETPISIDTDIFQWIVTNTQVDGIKIQRYKNTNNMYIAYENELFIKKIQYNHEIFTNYRLEEEKKQLEA